MKTKNVFVYTESYYCRKFTAKNDEAPEYFTLETVFIHAAQIVYITFGPPQNGIASYTYGI